MNKPALRKRRGLNPRGFNLFISRLNENFPDYAPSRIRQLYAVVLPVQGVRGQRETYVLRIVQTILYTFQPECQNQGL